MGGPEIRSADNLMKLLGLLRQGSRQADWLVAELLVQEGYGSPRGAVGDQVLLMHVYTNFVECAFYVLNVNTILIMHQGNVVTKGNDLVPLGQQLESVIDGHREQ